MHVNDAYEALEACVCDKYPAHGNDAYGALENANDLCYRHADEY